MIHNLDMHLAKTLTFTLAEPKGHWRLGQRPDEVALFDERLAQDERILVRQKVQVGTRCAPLSGRRWWRRAIFFPGKGVVLAAAFERAAATAAKRVGRA